MASQTMTNTYVVSNTRAGINGGWEPTFTLHQNTPGQLTARALAVSFDSCAGSWWTYFNVGIFNINAYPDICNYRITGTWVQSGATPGSNTLDVKFTFTKSTGVFSNLIPNTNSNADITDYPTVDILNLNKTSHYCSYGTYNATMTLEAYIGPNFENSKINVGGVWKTVNSYNINVNGVWKSANDIWVNVNGVWKKM